MSEVPMSVPAAPMRPQSEAAWLYGVAATVGCAIILAFPRAWFIPVLVMLIYLGIGLNQARSEGRTLEFGDSFYYLGFTLTVAALLASLKPFQSGGVQPHEVLRSFGLGLLTTLIGVIGRTVIQIFYRTADESLEATNRRVQEEAERYLGLLRILCDKTEQLVRGTVENLEGGLKEQQGAYGRQLEQYADKLRAAVESTAGLTLDTSGLDRGISKVAAALEKSATALDQGASRAAGLEGEFGKVVRALEAVVKAMQELEGKLRSVSVDSSPMTAAISRSAQGFESSARELRTTLTAVTTAAEGASVETDRLRARLSGIDAAPLQGAVSSLARQFEDAALMVSRHRKAVSDDALGPLERTLADTRRHAEELNRLLDDIAEAVRAKLKQI